jgi:microcystin-dependent protein
MPSTFSTSLRLELIGDGEQSGVWGQTTNNNFGELVEQAITGRTTLNVTSGDITLTSLNGVVDQARSAVLAVTGTPGVTRVLTIPNVEKSYTVINQTTNIIQVKTASGAAFNCPPSATTVIACDGLNGIQGSGIAPLTSPAFTGVPTAPTAALGTNTTQIATTAFVQSFIPVGVITLWSGSIASIPSGWALCNGSAGTPDLRDRFVVGAGSTYAVGATGGANTVTLDTTQIPSHTHTGSGTSNATDLSHTHTGSGTTGNNNVGHTHTGSGNTGENNVGHTHSGTTNDNNVGHTHTGSGTTSGFSNDHTHSGTTGINSVDHTHGVSGNTGGTSANHVHSYSGTTSTIGDHVHGSGTLYSQDPGSGNIRIQDGGGDNIAPFVNRDSAAAGAHSHTYSGNTDGQNVDHTHFFSVTSGGMSTNHNHNFTTGGQSANHDHTYSFTTSGQSSNHVHPFSTGGQSANHVHTYSFTTSGQSADHNHAFSFTTSGASVVMNHNHSFSFTSNATGGGLAHENRPPYYALAYIMKV